MSLVAYAASSDEESNHSEEEATTSIAKVNGFSLDAESLNGKNNSDKISDDEEDYAPTEFSPLSATKTSKSSAPSLSLPKPKNVVKSELVDEEFEITPIFSKLPTPKNTIENKTIIEEEDDEFLHKKASLPSEESKPKPVHLPQNKGPVKITIPSLKEFRDVDQELTNKVKNKPLSGGKKNSSLLSMLPQAKSERNFSKSALKLTSNDSNDIVSTPAKPSTPNPFIPDSVKNRRPAYNTEGVDGIKEVHKKSLKPTSKPKVSLVNCSESEGSGDEGGDFFSLNSDDKLPEVSKNEIDDFVAKRAAKMMKAKEQFLNALDNKNRNMENTDVEDETLELERQQKLSVLDKEAMQALAGSRAKRRKEENIQVLDISSDEVLPNREEWMRTTLASSTAYQPTGVLVDEEPAAGTRRKHQITYLAHKAKANEAELQAMWAANRQNRKATQSKYGF